MKIVWNSNGKGENNNKKQGGKKGTKKRKKKENKTKLKWSGNQIKKIKREEIEAQVCEPLKLRERKKKKTKIPFLAAP